MKPKTYRQGITHITAIIALLIVVVILLYLFGVVPYFGEVLLLVILGGGGAIYTWYATTALRKKPVTGVESLVGAKGAVRSETLSPEGEVTINGIIWKARLANPQATPLKKGDVIVVKREEELVLFVEQSQGTIA